MLDIRPAVRRIGVLEAFEPFSAGTQISIRALPAAARFALRLSPEIASSIRQLAGMDITRSINRASFSDDRIAARLGPDEWILIAPEPHHVAVLSQASAQLSPYHHALVDISHRNIAIEVSGGAVVDVINAGCPLDLNDDQFAPGHSTRTLLGKTEIILMRLSDTKLADDSSSARYRIECWRSFGPYLQHFLVGAAQEYLG